jgi:hypothetical protein
MIDVKLKGANGSALSAISFFPSLQSNCETIFFLANDAISLRAVGQASDLVIAQAALGAL